MKILFQIVISQLMCDPPMNKTFFAFALMNRYSSNKHFYIVAISNEHMTEETFLKMGSSVEERIWVDYPGKPTEQELEDGEGYFLDPWRQYNNDEFYELQKHNKVFVKMAWCDI